MYTVYNVYYHAGFFHFRYGFEGEVKAKLDETAMALFSEVFQALPLGAVIAKKVGGWEVEFAPRAVCISLTGLSELICSPPFIQR